MNLSRRNFLSKAGSVALASPFLMQALSSCKTLPKHLPFGLNIWTVRDEMAQDAKGTLKAIAEAGFEQIESFTGDKGIFWGMQPKDFKSYLSDIGLKMISAHVDPKFTADASSEDEYKRLLEQCNTVGVTHVFNPYPGPQKSSDDWKKLAEGLNRQGRISKAFGITSGYHNHHHEFITTPEGDLPYTLLIQGTDKEYVNFELDLYWSVKSGQDPEKWFIENPGRISHAHFKDLHLPDRIAEIEASDEPRSEEWPVGASTFLGNGQIDFAKILATGKKNGLKYYIVEQERFDNSTPLQDIVKDAEYMRNLLS